MRLQLPADSNFYTIDNQKLTTNIVVFLLQTVFLQLMFAPVILDTALPENEKTITSVPRLIAVSLSSNHPLINRLHP
jgi:hypothetical protein